MLKNRSASFLKISLFGTALAAVISCSTPSRSKNEKHEVSSPNTAVKSEEMIGPPAPYGPLPEAASTNSGPAYGPEPFQAKAIVLVLGPGLAKGFAHAGVLRALQEEKIPVAAIVATEMGALVGALYSQASSINSFEWSLQKFKPEIFQEKSGGFFKQNDSLPQPLKAQVEKIFGSKKIQDLKKPVKILLYQNRSLLVVNEGSVSESVETALTGNGYYAAASYQSKPATGATSERPYPVSEAVALGLGPVVVVDLIGNGKGDAGSTPEAMNDSNRDKVKAAFAVAVTNGDKDLNDAALVLKPALNNIGYLEFSKKSEAIFKGRSAVKDNLKMLRQLAGLPAEKLDEAPEENRDEKREAEKSHESH